MTTQANLPGIPPGNSLEDLRERQRKLGIKIAAARRLFEIAQYIEPGFGDVAAEYCEIEKQIAGAALVNPRL